jgi:hypothetical protein
MALHPNDRPKKYANSSKRSPAKAPTGCTSWAIMQGATAMAVLDRLKPAWHGWRQADLFELASHDHSQFVG